MINSCDNYLDIYRTHHPELLEITADQFNSLAPAGLPGVRAHRTRKNAFGSQRTVVVTYNENLFVAQSKTLLREIAKRQRGLGEIAARLGRWSRGEVRGGRSPSLEGTRNAVNTVLKGRHMKDLFEVELTLSDGLPDLVYRFRQGAWEKLQRTLLGKTLLFTDNHDWSDAQIVRAYRAQSHIEEGFRVMKDPHHIALRRQYHWTDQKVRVHVFTCVLALMLLSLLRRDLAHRGFHFSIPRILEMLGNIREVSTVFPPQGPETEPTFRTSLTHMSPEQHALFEALNLKRFTAR